MAEKKPEAVVHKHGIPGVIAKIGAFFAEVPLLGWLIGGLIAVIIERLVGLPLARLLGMPKIPALFGILFVLQKPLLIPSALIYVILIYGLPIVLVAKLLVSLTNRWAGWLLKLPLGISAVVHLGLLYAILQIWCDVTDYRLLVVRLILIAIIFTLSLNVINGYMGEFSCSHPGFIALGAYTASFFTVGLFINDNLFGPALLPSEFGIFLFSIGLILGGIVSALGAILVAVPSFRTRGDYLAIISLAFMFIIKSLLENLEFLGGPRGLSNQPDWASLPMVFVWTVLCVLIINNFVRSTLGKALNAVRDDEIAAAAMTINTKNTKMTAFLFAAFWAGVGGGLFAHVIRYVNPSTFGITMLAEVLAMTYFGGLNSVVGSIIGAVSINLLSETLRPLEIYKWIIIPLILILVMIYKPTGLFAFKEFDINEILKPKQQLPEEVDNAPIAN